MELKDLHLAGRKYTWSNAHKNPVLTKIDHFFHSDEWDMIFPNAHLQATSSACLDHAPLFYRVKWSIGEGLLSNSRNFG